MLDPGSTLSYVTLLVAVGFGFEPEMIFEPFSVSTPVGDSVVVRRVYRKCVVSIFGQNTVVDLIEINMVDFDVILWMDWLYSCFTTLNYRTRRVTFFIFE